MKIRLFILLILIANLYACTNKENSLLGTWTVDSKFYRATYKIIKENNQLKGLMIYYNDDTFKYKYDSTDKHYIFEDLKNDDGIYIDGLSGASSIQSKTQPIKIEVKNKDTLRVTTYIMKQALTELWIKNIEL